MIKENLSYQQLMDKCRILESRLKNIEEQQQEENQELFQVLFSESIVIKLIINRQTGRIYKANQAACHFFGFSPEEIEGLALENIMTTEEGNLWQKIQQADKNKRNYHNIKLQCKNNETKEAELYSSRIHLKDKNYQYLFIHDISEEKKQNKQLQQAKNELERQNLKISHLLQAAKTVLEFDDFKTTARKLFDSCKALTGAASGYVALLSDNGDENEVLFLDSGGLPCSVDESLPMPIRGLRGIAYTEGKAVYHNNFMNSQHIKFMPEGHVVLHNVMFAPLMVHQKAAGLIGLANKKGDFTEEDLEIISAFGELAAIALCNSRNLEELTEAKELAEEREKELNLTLDATMDGIWKWDFKKNELYFSPNYYKMLGYQPFEFEASFENWASRIHPEDKKQAISTAKKWLIQKEGNYFNTFRFQCKNGGYLWLIANGQVVEWDKEGNALRMIGNHINVSEIKRYEKQLIAAKEKAEQSSRLKTEFLNNMSHEVRTPLNGIMGFTQLLAKKNITEDKQRYFTSIILDSSRRLLRIIDDILEVSSLETGSQQIYPASFDINELLGEIFVLYHAGVREKGLELRFQKKLDQKQAQVRSDRTKLFRILSCLMENAMKFTLKGYVELGCEIKKEILEIFVKDSGIGIRQEEQQNIFAPFNQEDKGKSRSYGGLGLGLSIANGNARLLGGEIKLESQKEKGSCFRLLLPYQMAKEKNPEKETEKLNGYKQTGPYQILVAEDEQMNFLYIESLLQEFSFFDYTLIHVKNGREALEKCLRNPQIDLILMDLKMPVLDGFKASSEIKKIRPDLPIIAQTAYSDEEAKKRAALAGCDDFISKPMEAEEILTVLKKYLLFQSEDQTI